MISGGEIYFDTGLQHLPAEMIGSGNIGHSEQVQEIQLQSSSPTKTSHAIKIINPDTSTEIELPPRPKPKSKLQIFYASHGPFLICLVDRIHIFHYQM